MDLPVKFDKLLLPVKGVDMRKWGVVACDQYTSQPDYWEKLREEIGDEPSTLDLIFPECYLSDEPEARIAKIIASMNDYIDRGIFREVDNGLVLVERTTKLGNTRLGLTMIVDLTQYSFKPEDKALIRATEGTVVERIPPRVAIRKNCPLELPHILLLVDDPDRTVIEPLKKAGGEVLYDTVLSGGGGRVKGTHIANEGPVKAALQRLLAVSTERYGEPLLFAVGDGNHSLATAKACYDPKNPLSRYALVEVENIYDEGIRFEPIHRVFFANDREDFVSALKAKIDGPALSKIFVSGETRELRLPESAIEGVDAVQKFIDEYKAKKGGELDYIHGEADLKKICAERGGVGVVLLPMDKGELFGYIVKKGVLPRKTFSMGEAAEKRYYMEARRIK